jgi:hypothetical protein
VALDDSQALWLAFGFCQKQKQLKAPTKGTLNLRVELIATKEPHDKHN